MSSVIQSSDLLMSRYLGEQVVRFIAVLVVMNGWTGVGGRLLDHGCHIISNEIPGRWIKSAACAAYVRFSPCHTACSATASIDR